MPKPITKRYCNTRMCSCRYISVLRVLVFIGNGLKFRPERKFLYSMLLRPQSPVGQRVDHSFCGDNNESTETAGSHLEGMVEKIIAAQPLFRTSEIH